MILIICLLYTLHFPQLHLCYVFFFVGDNVTGAYHQQPLFVFLCNGGGCPVCTVWAQEGKAGTEPRQGWIPGHQTPGRSRSFLASNGAYTWPGNTNSATSEPSADSVRSGGHEQLSQPLLNYLHHVAVA